MMANSLQLKSSKCRALRDLDPSPGACASHVKQLFFLSQHCSFPPWSLRRSREHEVKIVLRNAVSFAMLVAHTAVACAAV